MLGIFKKCLISLSVMFGGFGVNLGSSVIDVSNSTNNVFRTQLKQANTNIGSNVRDNLKNISLNDYTLKKLVSGDEINQLVFSTNGKKKLNVAQWSRLMKSFQNWHSSNSLLNTSTLKGLNFSDDSFSFTEEFDKDTPDYTKSVTSQCLNLSFYNTTYSIGSTSLINIISVGWSRHYTYYSNYKNGDFQSVANESSLVFNYSSTTFFASYTMVSLDGEYLTPDYNSIVNTSTTDEDIDYTCFIYFYKPLTLRLSVWLANYYNSLSDDNIYLWNAVGPSISLIESKIEDSKAFESGYQNGYSQGYSQGKGDGLNGNDYNEGYNQGRTDSNKEFYEKVDSLEKENSSLKSDKDSLQQEYNDYKTSYNADVVANAQQEGYNNGLNSVTNDTSSIISLFGAITTIPLNILNGLASFSIWNTPVIYLIITFLFLAVVFWCIKKFCF